MERNQEDFARFVEAIEGRLRAALVARYGPETGRDATADALGWAWRNWERLADMERPLGYLYRVGQSNARRYRHRTWPLDFERTDYDLPKVYDQPMVEPRLHACLLELTERQRVSVVLVYGLLRHLSGKTITLTADADLLDGTAWVRPLLRLREPHLLIHLQHADGEAAIGERCRLGAQNLLEAHVRLPNDPRTPRDTCRSAYSRSLPNDAVEWRMADIAARYSVLDLGSGWVLPLEAGETHHAEALAAGLVIEDVDSGLPQVMAVDDSVSIDADLSQLQVWIVAPDGAVTELTIWPTCDLDDVRWAVDEEGEFTEQYSCVGDGAALVDEWPRAETLPDAPVPDEWASLTITVD